MVTKFGKLLRIIRINSGDSAREMAEKLTPYLAHARWGYLFETAYALCRALEIRYCIFDVFNISPDSLLVFFPKRIVLSLCIKRNFFGLALLTNL